MPSPTQSVPGFPALQALLALAVVQGLDASVTQLPTWELVEETRIGELEGEGSIGQLGAFAADAAQRVWLYDSFDQSLRLYDRNGDHLGSFGREGAGPGEFSGVLATEIAPNGNLWLVDAGNQRYTVVSPDLQLVKTIRRPVNIYSAGWFGGFVDNVFHDQATLPRSHDGDLPFALVRLRTSGAVVDSVLIPSSQAGTQSARRGSLDLPLPFSRTRLYDLDSRGNLAWMSSDSSRLHRQRLVEDESRAVLIPTQPRRLSGGERDSIAIYNRALQDQLGVSVDDDRFPEVFPVIASVFSSDDDSGMLWVMTTECVDGARFYVVDTNDRVVAMVGADYRFASHPAPRVVGDRVWAPVLGEYDETYLVRFRINKSVSGSAAPC